MTDANTIWRETDPDAPQGGELADGTYDCTLQEVEDSVSKAGNRGIKWIFTDNRSGSQIFKWSNFRPGDYSESWGNDSYWLKKDIKPLGVMCDTIDEIIPMLRSLIGATVRVEIVTPKMGGLPHVKIIKNLTGPPEKMYEGTPPEEDVPF
jgi:hypothetical protein